MNLLAQDPNTPLCLYRAAHSPGILYLRKIDHFLVYVNGHYKFTANIEESFALYLFLLLLNAFTACQASHDELLEAPHELLCDLSPCLCTVALSPDSDPHLFSNKK
jgi:hypothetical protein